MHNTRSILILVFLLTVLGAIYVTFFNTLPASKKTSYDSSKYIEATEKMNHARAMRFCDKQGEYTLPTKDFIDSLGVQQREVLFSNRGYWTEDRLGMEFFVYADGEFGIYGGRAKQHVKCFKKRKK